MTEQKAELEARLNRVLARREEAGGGGCKKFSPPRGGGGLGIREGDGDRPRKRPARPPGGGRARSSPPPPSDKKKPAQFLHLFLHLRKISILYIFYDVFCVLVFVLPASFP